MFDYIGLVSVRYNQAKSSQINRLVYSGAGGRYSAVYRECTGDLSSVAGLRDQLVLSNLLRRSEKEPGPGNYTEAVIFPLDSIPGPAIKNIHTARDLAVIDIGTQR